MYKQGNELERFSEFFISKLTKQLGFPCAEYLPNDRFIKTKDLTEGKYNFEPMAALIGENEEYILNFDNNIALISRGYAAQAKNSANLIIELFGELLKEKISAMICLLSHGRK